MEAEPSRSLPRKRGRPKDEDRRLRILQAARALFLEHGFQAVSVDTIADTAAVSNRTVYSHFPSKDDLLWAIIRAEGEAIRPIPDAQLPTNEREFRNSLVKFGCGLVSLLTTPSIIRLGTLMLSESGRHPELADSFYRWGPQQSRDMLGQWMLHARSKGWLSKNTPPHAGDHLLALWQGMWHLPQQLGLKPQLTRARIKKHVEECVDLILRAYTPVA